jgi:excisionase family DNA binding protein
MSAKPIITPKGQSVADFCSTWNLSRPTAYRLINRGHLRTVQVGRKRLILVDSADALFRDNVKIQLR